MDEVNNHTEIMKVYEAASGNHITELKQSLDGACGELKQEDLELALLVASKNGHIQCVELLLDKNVNISCTDGQDNTPLILASEAGHVDVVRMLLQNGCSVICHNSLGKSPLMKACEWGHLDVAELLMEFGAGEETKTEPNMISRTQNNVVARKLNPLMITVLKAPKHKEDLVRLLLRRNAAVNDKDAEKCTVLHFAAKIANVAVIKLLLSAGADVNAQDFWGATPLMNAVSCNSVENARMLLQHGADVSRTDNSLRTALSIAARSDGSQLVELLLLSGADINHLDAHTNPPLFIAISHRNHTAAKCLIQHGCNLTLVGRHMSTRKVMTFLQLAIWFKDTQMIEMLYRAGAFTNTDLYNLFINPDSSNNCADPAVWEYLTWLVRKPRPLISSCRQVILRSFLGSRLDSIDQLHLPSSLKEYLKFSDIIL